MFLSPGPLQRCLQAFLMKLYHRLVPHGPGINRRPINFVASLRGTARYSMGVLPLVVSAST